MPASPSPDAPNDHLSLKAFIERILEEREQRYLDKFKDLRDRFETAINSLNKATEAAFAASEKAITKSEEAQREYNTRSNEFRGALDDQNKRTRETMVPRSEWEGGHKEFGIKIDDLKKIVNEKASQEKVDSLSRLVYIGMGMAILLSVLIPIALTLLRSK